jgi:phasin
LSKALAVFCLAALLSDGILRGGRASDMLVKSVPVNFIESRRPLKRAE